MPPHVSDGSSGHSKFKWQMSWKWQGSTSQVLRTTEPNFRFVKRCPNSVRYVPTKPIFSLHHLQAQLWPWITSCVQRVGAENPSRCSWKLPPQLPTLVHVLLCFHHWTRGCSGLPPCHGSYQGPHESAEMRAGCKASWWTRAISSPAHCAHGTPRLKFGTKPDAFQ